MNVGTIKPSPISFMYSHKLKKLYKQGKLPTVKVGLMGGALNNKNCSLDHAIPASLGGKTITENLSLMTRENNSLRGNDNLKDFVTVEMAQRYLAQFVDVVVGNFVGNKYIQKFTKTLHKLDIMV